VQTPTATETIGSNKVVASFLLKAGGLYVLWHLVYQLYLEKEGVMIRQMAAVIASASLPFLRMLGHNVSTRNYNGFDTMLTLDGTDLVWIDSGCTGLTLMALFAGFIVAYPGPLRHKAWFIPVGVLIIYAVNLLRVVVLALNHIRSRSTFDFNHKFTYTLVVYAAIFGLWVLWANRFSGFSLTAPADQTDKSDPGSALPLSV